MLWQRRPWLTQLALAGAASALFAPIAAPQEIPKTISGYLVTLEIKALAPQMAPAKAPEAEALMGKFKQQSQLTSKFSLAQALSRQEILSTDFVLPAGTVLLHKAGDRYYAIADMKAKTYIVMDAETLLNALEGGVGIVNTAYEARVAHTSEKKMIAGYACRKSVVTVTYVSSVPFENDRVLVQQKNDIDVWHTSDLVSTVALDHFFFKFQRDRTGAVQKALSMEIGFPMEVNFVVTQGAPGAKKAAQVQPGSFHMLVTEVKVEKALDSELFRIPPAGFTRVEKNPFTGASLPGPGTEVAQGR